VVIIIALLLYHRRLTKAKSEFDGNFDPARVTPRPFPSSNLGGTLPRMNIDEYDEGVGGQLPQSSVSGGISAPFAPTPGSLPQHQNVDLGRSQGFPTANSPLPMSQYSADGYSPTIATTSSGAYHGATPQQIAPSSGYLPTSRSTPSRTNSGSSGNTSYNNLRSAKEREALSIRTSVSGHLGVANPSQEPENEGILAGGYDEQARQAYLQMGPQSRRSSEPDSGMYGSSTWNSSSPPVPLSASGSVSPEPDWSRNGVTVHRDGGRLQLGTAEGDVEIPPAYDSISTEDRR